MQVPTRRLHPRVARDQFSGKRREAVQLSVGPTIGDRESVSLDAAEFAKACAELINERVRVPGVVKHAHVRQALRTPGLLRARREWPACYRAAKRGYQFSPSDGDCHAPSREDARRGR